jgi:hypothetical protein
MSKKPNVNSDGERELQKLQSDFDSFDNKVSTLTMDAMNALPKRETEQQTKLSQSEIAKTPDVYMRPIKTISCADRFNEDYRSEYEFQKEYVYFTAENKEVIGESLDFWTKPFAGIPAEEWKIPVNKPIWAPRYVAEQIKRKHYTKLVMKERPVESTHAGSFYGELVGEEKVQRLDAHPVSTRKSIFMSA